MLLPNGVKQEGKNWLIYRGGGLGVVLGRRRVLGFYEEGARGLKNERNRKFPMC